MAKSFNVAILLVAVAAAILQSTEAANYTVGGPSGWFSGPPGGAAFYSAWASNFTFRVNDTLVFNFTTGRHAVAVLTKANFDNCNVSNPIEVFSTGPANVTLNRTGEFYFACPFTGHCASGQKLSVNVTGSSSSPAPGQAPSPSSGSTPTSSSANYTVGGPLGWFNAPPGGAAFYSAWASNFTFRVNDTLVFNFTTGRHAVAVLTKANFDNCNVSNPIEVFSTGPANVTLNRTGEFYFACPFTGHCASGQKLSVNVTGSSSSPAPGQAPSPSSGSTPTSPSGKGSPNASPTEPGATAPPPNSKATSVAASFSVLIMAIVLNLLL